MKEKYDAEYAAWLKDGGSEAIKQVCDSGLGVLMYLGNL